MMSVPGINLSVGLLAHSPHIDACRFVAAVTAECGGVSERESNSGYALLAMNFERRSEAVPKGILNPDGH
jgi:hypothetical protein